MQHIPRDLRNILTQNYEFFCFLKKCTMGHTKGHMDLQIPDSAKNKKNKCAEDKYLSPSDFTFNWYKISCDK